MQFSKLRLIGFKSFVDPVELDILSGLTGIVGPNGCGKSNLLEALRWVMGENRASSMRSGVMDDVIFAGAGTRMAKNFAEVVIGLDNVECGPESENSSIEIVRRVTREIGSSYRLNGKDVRAKDISMLFADSSTGAHSPSLVRQGQIAELVNANPKSRRRLLEEAAGISGLYQRRHEAELKLKASETNMGRLQDIIEQLETQIKTLAKQARQASKYVVLAQNIRDNEVFLFCQKWFESEKKMLEESNAFVTKTKLSASAERELLLSTKKREEVEEKLPELRSEETRASAAHQRLIVEKEGLENEQRRAEIYISELKMRAEETSKDYARQNILINDAKEVIERIKWESSQLKKLSLGQHEAIEKTHKEASDAAKKLTADELKLDDDAEDFARLSARLQNYEKQIEKAKDGLEKVTGDLKIFDESIVQLVGQLSEKQKDVAGATKNFDICKEESKYAETGLDNIEKKRAEAVKEELKKRIDFSTYEGKLAALQSESDALRALISATSGGTNQILNDIVITKGYEAALGAAFSDEFTAPIIFTNDQTGWFQLPDEEERSELPPGVEEIARKVTAPNVLRRRLANIGVVDSSDGPRLQRFLKIGQKLVSKDGALWRWDGYCCTAEDNGSEATVRLKQENRLVDLQSEIEGAREQVNLLETALKQAQDQANVLEEAGTLARNDRSKCDEKMSEASREVSRVESEMSIINSKLHSMRENLSSGNKARELLEAEILELGKMFESRSDLESKRHLLEEQRSVVEKSRELMVEKRALYDQLKRDVDIRFKRSAELDLDLKNWEQRLNIANESTFELEKRKITVAKDLQAAEMLPGSLLNRRDDLTKIVEEAKQKKLKALESLSKKESNFRRCVTEERDLSRKVSGLREDVARAQAIKENAELNLTELSRVIKEETSSDAETLIKNLTLSLDDLPSISDIEVNLNSLKNSRDALGAVNLRAAEDSKELSIEWENLLTERIDLENAIKKLRAAIVALNSEGRTRLLDAFQAVNKNFEKLFENLFGGGTAKLTFIESEDPLEAGLEIICQPPGKKLSTLSLLSGGEQTLTALALIFAVFKANPSPICVLDEVDAPLDDANVERFCALLDEMTRTTNTRFMIITHHPLTMSRMDRLYGVTMVERGVSQLVSVDLKKAEELVDF